MDVDKIAAVTLLIYDVALDDACWPALLAGLASLFDSHFADSFRRTTDYSRFSGIAFGLDARDYDEEFLGYWVSRNVWGTRRPVRRAGDVLSSRDMLPPDELVRTEMYNDYLAPRGLHEGLRLDLWAAEGWIEDISLLRPWSAGPYTDGERRLAQTLLPHLQRSATVSRRLREGQSRIADTLSVLERLQSAVIMLDGQGRVLHQNGAATRLLAQADGLAVGPAGLVAANLAVSSQLQGLVAAAAAPTRSRSGTLQAPRPSGRPPLSLTVMPLHPESQPYAAELAGAARVMVCVSDPQAGADLRLNRLTARYRLTQAEAALATDLLAGQELRQIAERRGRSLNTIRTQLAGLMDKTDTRRQAELVGLLARSGAEQPEWSA